MHVPSVCLFVHFSIAPKQAVVFCFSIPNSDIKKKTHQVTALNVYALFVFFLFTFVTSRKITFLQCRLKKSNKTQQYSDIYLLLNYSACFGCPSRPSSGVHKTVVAACGTDYTIWEASFFKHGQIRSPYLVTFKEPCSPDRMICTRGCNYSFVYSWWWARWMHETCRVI